MLSKRPGTVNRYLKNCFCVYFEAIIYRHLLHRSQLPRNTDTAIHMAKNSLRQNGCANFSAKHAIYLN